METRFVSDKADIVVVREPARYLAWGANISRHGNLHIYDRDIPELTKEEVDSLYGVNPETLTEIPYLSRHGETLQFELESFHECVSTRGNPVVSGEDGTRALELARRVAEACDT